MSAIRFLFFCAVVAVCGCTAPAPPPQQQLPDLNAQMELQPLLKPFKQQTIRINYDPELKRAATYQGLPTQTLFAALVQQYNLDTARYAVAFICSDGYAPNQPLGQLFEPNGYIVTRNLEAPGGWTDPKFGPAYLVWDLPKPSTRYAFPYSITHIQFIPKSLEYRLALPVTDNAAIQQGFEIFKEHCIKCHSVNQEGGSMGPELNFPNNVTEYWKTDQLKVFIKNPPAFRAGCKMPPPPVTEEEIDLILNYLKFMSNHKR